MVHEQTHTRDMTSIKFISSKSGITSMVQSKAWDANESPPPQRSIMLTIFGDGGETLVVDYTTHPPPTASSSGD